MYNQSYYNPQYTYQNNYENNSGFCTPLIIYVVLSILTATASFTSTKKTSTENTNTESTSTFTGSGILYNLVFSLILYLLCKNGYNTVAWILLLLPLIGALVALLAFVSVLKAVKTD